MILSDDGFPEPEPSHLHARAKKKNVGPRPRIEPQAPAWPTLDYNQVCLKRVLQSLFRLA